MTGRQRICHLLHHLALGGLETQLLRFIEATPDDRVAYTAYSFGDDSSMRSEYEAAGVRVECFEFGSASSLSQFSPRTVWKVVERLRREKFDALHVHGNLYLQAFGRICGRISGTPVVGTYHNHSDDFQLLTRALERATRPLSYVDLAVSEDVERSYAGSAKRYDRANDTLDRSTYTIQNGIDVDGFNAAVRRANGDRVRAEAGLDDELLFLNIGRYAAQKNQCALVRAMADVVAEYPRSHLFVVGHGPMGDELRRTAVDAGVADSVTVTGRVDSVHEYYDAADAFVLPSLTEGLSVVLLESMAAELPVIATDAPGTAEAVVNGTTGFITGSERPADIAAAMMRMTDSETRRRLGRNGFERVRSEFSIEVAVRSYLDVYRRLGDARRSDSFAEWEQNDPTEQPLADQFNE